MHTLCSFAVRSALVVALAAPVAVCQQPYGVATAGTGGLKPALSSVLPTVGNANFALGLHSVAPSSPVFTLIGSGSGRLPIAGITLNLAPTGIAITLPGTASTQGTVRVPLPIPNSAGLVGIPLFAQSIVVDVSGPQGLAASQGLRFAVGDAPRVFVACSIANGDPFHYFVPASGTRLDNGTPAQVDNVTAAVFDEAGHRLFVASSIRSTIGVANTRTTPLTWSTIYTGAKSCYGLKLDAERELLWTLTDPGTGVRELVALDAAAGSPTYGQVKHQTNGVVTGLYERWGMSPSGAVAGILTFLPSTLTIVDTDPSSPTFLMARHRALPVPVDATSPISLPTQVRITPDNRYALVAIQLAGTTPAEIARLDLSTGRWVDHNGSAAGVNIGAASVPAIPFGSAPTSLTISNDGSFAIVGGFGGCGWVGRLSLDPNNPQALGWQGFSPAAPLENGWTAGLSRDESEIAVATWPDSRCGTLTRPQLVRMSARTGAQLGVIAIPANSNRTNQNWYTVVYR